jgi:hypothetical protein
MIRFYFKKGRWHVTSDKRAVPANDWWNAINQVKCLNHKLRMEKQHESRNQAGHTVESGRG